ncbi:hypothetical protein [Hubei odonate virus 2]|uniref:hypothetical protein n=1 Tax=Hubei odonate virus 2 TaxID=1922997 RepID=UPI00090BBC6F|nr:hypothetical protein [Hubei odonate virus 2]APG77962.1 hypothetical protein [Hubei odonate virus 2]
MNSSHNVMTYTQSSSSRFSSYSQVLRSRLPYGPVPQGIYSECPIRRRFTPARIVNARHPKYLTGWRKLDIGAKKFLARFPTRSSCLDVADKKMYDRCRRVLRCRQAHLELVDERREARYWAAQRAQDSSPPRIAQPTSTKTVKKRTFRPLDTSNCHPDEYFDSLKYCPQRPPVEKRSLAHALLRTKPGAALLCCLSAAFEQRKALKLSYRPRSLCKGRFPYSPFKKESMSYVDWAELGRRFRKVKGEKTVSFAPDVQVKYYPLEPQMEGASAQGEGDLGHVITGNVVLTEARENSTASGPTEGAPDWAKISSDDVITSISNLTDRFVPIANFVWPRDAAHNNQNDYICDIDLPKDFVLSFSQSMCDLPNALPFLCHMYSKFDMEIKVHVNCNKFQIGQLQGTFWYEDTMDNAFPTRNNIWCASQNHHILISAGTSNEATLRVPFVYRKSFLLNKKMKSMEDPLHLGRFRLAIMNPLTATSSVAKKAYGTVFIKFSNAIFTGMKSGALGSQRAIHPSSLDLASLPTLIEPQSGGDERVTSKTAIMSPGRTLQSTSNGQLLFGESFMDLKDLCRRYQYYATYTGSKQTVISGTGKVCAVIPLMAQGLDLGIDGFGKGGTQFGNFHRDGHIPIVCSGFRYFRGGLRFKIVGPKIVKANMLVQHIPPLMYHGDQLIPCSSIHSSIDMVFHTYSSYVQNLGLNNIVEIEVPYYNSGCYTLLQYPKVKNEVLSDAQSFYDLGQLIVSIDLVGTDPLTIGKTWSVVAYYAFADDARCSLFQGFPPMIVLDEIQYNIGTSNLRLLEPQMDEILKVGAMKLLDAAFPDNNRDNPPDTSPSLPVVLNSSHSWCAGTGTAEPINSLRLDPRGQTRFFGGVGSDEMQVSSIVNVWGFIKTLQWSTDKKFGDPVFVCDASPIIALSNYKKWQGDKQNLPLYVFPPVAVISSLFHFWRGDLEFRFDFICSQYHTGRLMLAYVPGQDETITLAQARASPHVIFTLNESDQCIFKIPYIADRPWWPRNYSYGDSTTSHVAPSQLCIFVLNPLVVMDSVPNIIDINMYMRGGSSFEVAIPAQPSLGLGRNTHYRPLPDGYSIAALQGYDPYYLGYEHSFYVGEKYYGIFRYSTNSEALTQFPSPDVKYLTKTIWVLAPNETGPRADFKGTMQEVTACVLVRIDKKYIYALPIPTNAAADAILAYLATEPVVKLGLDWDWKAMVANLWVVDSSSSNTWSREGLRWYPKQFKKVTSIEPQMMGVMKKVLGKDTDEQVVEPTPSKPNLLERTASNVISNVTSKAATEVVEQVKETISEHVAAIKEAIASETSDETSNYVLLALTNLLHVIVNFNIFSISVAVVSLLLALGKYLYNSYDKILNVVQKVFHCIGKDPEIKKEEVDPVKRVKAEQESHLIERIYLWRSMMINRWISEDLTYIMSGMPRVSECQKLSVEDEARYLNLIPVSPTDPLYQQYLHALFLLGLAGIVPQDTRLAYLCYHSDKSIDIDVGNLRRNYPEIHSWGLHLFKSYELLGDLMKAYNNLDKSDKIKSLIPQGGDAVELSPLERDVSDLLSMIFSAISQGMSFSNRPEHIKKKWRETLFTDVSLFSRGANNVIYFVRNLFTVIKNMVRHIADWVAPNYRAARALSEVVPSLSVFSQECHTLLHPTNQERLLVDAQLQARVIDAAMYATIIRSYACESKVEGFNAISQVCKDILELRDTLARKGRSPLVRPSPFTVCLCGETGVGKTFIADKLMCSLVQEMKLPVTSSPIYTLNNAEHWDGLIGTEPCVYGDDLFLSRDATTLMRDVNRIYEIKNTAPLQPKMASLEQKGLQYSPAIFWYNTNIPFPDESCIAYPKAVYSRRDFLIRVIKTPEYINKNLNDLPVDELAQWKHVEFYASTAVTNPSIMSDMKSPHWVGPMTFFQFVPYMRQAFRKYYEREQAKYHTKINDIYNLLDASVTRINKELHDPTAVISEETINEKFVKAKIGAELALKGNNILPNVPPFQRQAQILYNSAVVQAFEKFFNLPSLVYDRKLLDSLRTKFNLKYLNTIKTTKIEDPVVQECYMEAISLVDEPPPPAENLVMSPEDLKMLEKEAEDDPPIFSKFSAYKGSEKGWDAVKVYLGQIMPRPSLLQSLYGDESTSDPSKMAAILSFAQNITISDKRECWYVGEDIQHFYYFLGKAFTSGTIALNAEPCSHYTMLKQGFDFDNGVILSGKTKVSFDICSNNPMCLCYLPLFHNIVHYSLFHKNYGYIFAFKQKKLDQIVPRFKESAQTMEYSAIKKFCINVSALAHSSFTKFLKPALFKLWSLLSSKWFIMGLATLGTVAAIIMRSPAHALMSSTTVLQQSLYDTKPLPSSSVAYAHPVLMQASNNEINDTIRCLQRNFVVLNITFNDSVFERNYVCLMLKGRLCLVILHYYEDIKAIFDSDDSARLYLMIDGGRKIPLIFEDLKFKWFKKFGNYSNFGVVEFPVRVRQFAKITHFIASKNSLSSVGTEGVFVRPDSTININLKLSKHYQVIASETSSSTYIETGFEYGVTKRGYCGSLIIACGLSKGVVVGMHVGGDSKIGVAEPICLEMFEEIKQERSHAAWVSLPKLDDVALAKIMPDTNIYPLGVVENKLAHKESGKTQIIPSEIAGVFPITTEPNPLSAQDPRLPPGNSPMLRGVGKHGIVPIGFPDSILRQAYTSLRNKILSHCKPVRVNISPLTLEQACCGDVNIPHCEPLSWSTSEGFYLNAHRPPGNKGKKWLFNLKEDADGYKLDGINDILASVMSLKEKLRSKSIVPFTCFVDCLKDTRLPKEKCSVPGKTRIFSISPVDFTIQFKQYYQDFISSYQYNRQSCEHAIGIDCVSYEWTSYYKILQSKGPKVISGDYSNFGPGMVMECVYYALQIIIDWYVHYGVKDDHLHMLYMLREEILNANHLCFNLVYTVASSIPSGSPITTPLNSLVNCLYIRCAWVMLGMDLAEFDRHVALVTYGDDIVINVSDDMCEKFNLKSISDVLLTGGIVFTHCSKQQNDCLYENINDITFLKRKWLAHPKRKGVFLAPLDEGSVKDCANWILNKGNFREASILNSEQAVQLAFSHGPEFYEEVAETIRKAWQKLHHNFSYKSWSTLDSEFFEK